MIQTILQSKYKNLPTSASVTWLLLVLYFFNLFYFSDGFSRLQRAKSNWPGCDWVGGGGEGVIILANKKCIFKLFELIIQMSLQ